MFIKFLLVTISNFVLSYGFYYVTIFLGVDYRVSYTLSVVVGLVFTTVVNANYTFNTKSSFKTNIIYGIYYIAHYLFNLNLLIFLVDGGFVSKLYGPVASSLILYVPHFLISRLIVLKYYIKEKKI